MAALDTIELVRTKLLLVEGKEDKALCEHLLALLQINDVQIHDCKGVRGIKDVLGTLHLATGADRVKTVGAIRDADKDPVTATLSVRNAMLASSIAARHKQAFVAPDNCSPGSIEDLFLRAVADTPVGGCLKAFFECLEKQGLQALSSSHLKSGIFLTTRQGLSVHAGLPDAMRHEPELLMHAAFDPLKNFLRELFGPAV